MNQHLNPPRKTGAASTARTLLRVHRASAVVVAGFVLLHLANHVAGFAGQDMHRSVQEFLRLGYRGGLEPVLLAACVLQVATGLRMAWARRARFWRSGVQLPSGLYLALFLGIHLSAVLFARWQGTETDLAFAAAGMHAGYWWLFFAPYYGLAVLAVGLHLSVPLGRRHRALGRATALVAAGLAVALVALLAGFVTPLHIAPALLQAFPH